MTQKDGVGALHLVANLRECPFTLGSTACGGGTGQSFLGFRVPQGAELPESISTTSGHSATYFKNDTYTSELQRLVPAPAGEKWVGYISNADSIIASDTPTTGTVELDIPLPKGADGAPFNGPFTYRTVTGGRFTGPGNPFPSQQVRCDPTDPTAPNLTDSMDISGAAVCIASPSDLTTIKADEQLATRDLSLQPGSARAILPGDTGNVPFNAKFAGPDATGVNMLMTATSNLAGAFVQPSVASFTPSPDNLLNVSVKVPARAAPGTYTTTLRAAQGDAIRTATASFTVPALPPGAAPSFVKKTVSTDGKSATLALRCPATAIDPCDGTVTLASLNAVQTKKRKITIGSAHFVIAPGKLGGVKVKFTKNGRKAFKKAAKIKTKATFVTKNRAGTANTKSTTFTLKKKGKTK
ncbi:MAG: hypothetical protein ACJ76V_12290 [Thermoleophilaceae bacterium]